MVSACWGVFVWREFAGAPRAATVLLVLMFLFFSSGAGIGGGGAAVLKSGLLETDFASPPYTNSLPQIRIGWGSRILAHVV